MYRGFNAGSLANASYGFGFPWGGLVMGLLVVAIIAVLVVVAIRLGKNGKSDLSTARQKGIDILVERFARGEIDAEAFRTMKAEIESKV